MNLWPIVIVGLVGLMAGLFSLSWPFVQTLNPATPPGMLLRLVETIAGASDLSALITLYGEEGQEITARVYYLRTPALRLELISPQELEGEIYTLRKIEAGWLLVHWRPREKTGIESRLTVPEWEETLALIELNRLRQAIWLTQVNVTRAEDGALEVRGKFGPFRRVLVWLDPDTNLPTRLKVIGEETLDITIEELQLNQDLTLRDLLSLPEQPEVWIQTSGARATGSGV